MRSKYCRLMGGDCGRSNRRYGSIGGFERLCEHVRNYGCFRSWIGGGPMDGCGLVSYGSYPAAGLDYSYLNYVTQAVPVNGSASSTTNCGCNAAPMGNTLPVESAGEGSTTMMLDDTTQSLYDGTNSIAPAVNEGERDSELIPRGQESDE